MAIFVLTFGRLAGGSTSVPLEDASSARSEELTIPGSDGQEVSTLEALGREGVLTVYAEDPVWMAVGLNPDAGTGENRRYIAGGAQRQFSVSEGQKVAILGAS